MACRYIIKAPDGGEDIEIPASFGLIVVNTTITDLLVKLQSFSNRTLTEDQIKEKEDTINSLLEALKRVTPSQISNRVIRDTITKNIDTTINIIGELDTKIEALGTYANIDDALYKYITSKWGNLADLHKKLSKPIKPKYFTGLSMDGVIGVTNLKQERSKILARREENLEFGFSNTIPDNLNTFINGILGSVNKEYKQIFEANVLLGTSNTFGGRAINIDGFTLFNTNDDLSLFLGLFKRVGSDIDKVELYRLLEDFNTDARFKKYGKIELGDINTFDVKKFFNGEVNSKNKLMPSGFDQLLDLSKSDLVKPYITAILKLVSDHLKPENTTLFKGIQKLFWTLDPDKYGGTALKNELLQEKFINSELKEEQKYKGNLRANFLNMVSKTKDEYFAANETISGDLFQSAMENIALNQDIVKFELENTGRKDIDVFGVVTGIYPKSNGVLIHGVYKNQYGETEVLKKLFKTGKDVITYRKREDSKALVQLGEIVNRNDIGLVVATDTSFPQDMLKRLLSKGDIVNGELVVIGVHAGVVWAKRKGLKGHPIPIQYSKIKVFISKQAQEDMEMAKRPENPKRLVQITDGALLSDGDLFIDPGTSFYKQVLYSDAVNVYSWIIQEGKDTVITSTKKSDIKDGLVYTYGMITLPEVNAIKAELAEEGRSKASMSIFVNKHDARDGDYFIVTIDDNIKYCKVTNAKARKGAYYDKNIDRIVPVIYDNKNPKFLTNRDISSNFSLAIGRVNDWNVIPLDETTANKDKKFRPAQYVVPINTDLSSLVLLQSNYANIGKFRDMDAEVNPLTEKVATDQIIRLMQNEGTDMTGLKLYLKAFNTTSKKPYYDRNIYGLSRINNFSELETDVKAELNILHPGVYFSVYNDKGGIDSNIYRIMSVTDGKVTANINKMSFGGKMLTIEKEFKVSDLLTTKPEGEKYSKANSISALYLQYGNDKFSLVIKAISDKGVGVKGVINQKAIDETIKKMQVAFEPLKITIKEVTAKKGSFENGQQAKIETLFDDKGVGTTSILLNKNNGTRVDLVHEVLHVYLTALRYTEGGDEIYNKFLNSVLTGTDLDLDVTAKEEAFVKIVSNSVKDGTDFISENLPDFIKSLATALKLLNPEFDVTIDGMLTNPLLLLNTPLKDAFGVELSTTHPMFNLSIIMTEPLMRE